jgi:hypothetical protein
MRGDRINEKKSGEDKKMNIDEDNGNWEVVKVIIRKRDDVKLKNENGKKNINYE